MGTVMLVIAAIACLAVSILSIRKEPRRFFNAFLIELLGILVFTILAKAAKPGNIAFAAGEFLFYFWNTIVLIFGFILLVDFVLVIRREGKSIPNILPLFLAF